MFYLTKFLIIFMCLLSSYKSSYLLILKIIVVSLCVVELFGNFTKYVKIFNIYL